MIHMHGYVYAADFANPTEAVKWLLQSASAGHVRAQYQLALCLHHGRGIKRNLLEAVWIFFYFLYSVLIQYNYSVTGISFNINIEEIDKLTALLGHKQART